ncbi:MAG TPA: maleylpyruvate isomerase family mycothiol-dependent enzyme [Streptosporangiaceae bacterium]|nr:maleylpyruvate isomerase family mycothiol-dependent enzyme [Streptosporangiaceae bacterium]
MTAPVTEDQWNAVRDSVRATARRFCDLVASVPDPAATASAGWSVADVTAHVTTISFLNTMLMGAAEPPFQMPGLTGAIAATTVDTVHGLNDQVMSHFLERDVSRLLDTLRHHVGLMLTASREHDPEETFSWLGEARPTLAGMFAHMVNELLIHGNDIASAVKVPWAMPAPDAALFFDLFYVGLANGELGRLLDGSKRPLRRRIAAEFRSGYTAPVTIVVRNGQVSAEPAGPGADVKVRFDPATLNMMMFGRIGKLQAVLTRKIIISGRRPWLMPAFLRTVRFPS